MVEVKSFKTKGGMDEFIECNNVKVLETSKETFNFFGDMETRYIVVYR
jgi:hypothetical protein